MQVQAALMTGNEDSINAALTISDLMDQTLEQNKPIFETAEEMFKEQEEVKKKEEVKEVKPKQDSSEQAVAKPEVQKKDESKPGHTKKSSLIKIKKPQLEKIDEEQKGEEESNNNKLLDFNFEQPAPPKKNSVKAKKVEDINVFQSYTPAMTEQKFDFFSNTPQSQVQPVTSTDDAFNFNFQQEDVNKPKKTVQI